MNIYMLALHLAGGVTLLLWSVRMVRTGVERSYLRELRQLLGGGRNNFLRGLIGAVSAVMLQSSTAVALLVAGFAASGLLSVSSGLALLLGADLGSALVVRLLSLNLEWLIPILLIVGGTLFLRFTARRARQTGRILVGLALILLSLQLIGNATEPLRESTALPAIVGYLQSDALMSFLVGALFTWLLHSSVASVLLIANFAGQGIIGADLALTLLLGANLGAGLIAVGLTRAGPIEARIMTLGNLLVRTVLALIAISMVVGFKLSPDLLGTDAHSRTINAHLLFNAIVAIIGLPLVGPVTALVARLIPRPAAPTSVLDHHSALDPDVMNRPSLALASATREILAMANLVERMLRSVPGLFESGDRNIIKSIREVEQEVNTAQSRIKLYLTSIAYPPEDTAGLRRGHELAEFTINLEHVGDIITKTLLPLIETRRDRDLRFSTEGWRELLELHERVVENMKLSLNVLVASDLESAQTLLAEKQAMRAAEQRSLSLHLRRLQSGKTASLETSNLHLETVRALRTINSALASIAYPIVAASPAHPGGQLSTLDR